MSLLDLPVELILQIASYLEKPARNFRNASINSLARTNRRLYKIVDPFLYRLDIQQRSSGAFYSRRAISHAVNTGLLNTAWKSYQAGASVYDGYLEHVVTAKRKSLELTTMLLDEDMWSEGALLQALLSAVSGNRVEIAKELLSRDGVDPSKACYGHLPLVEAVEWRGHHASVDLLLADPRTDPNVLSRKGRTVLEEAAKEGHTNIVRSLLARGASAQPNVQTPMHSAVINRDPEMVKLFLNRDDVDLNAIFNGQTPLHHAVNANRKDLVELLLGDEQVDVNLTGMANGRTPLLDATILNNNEVIGKLLSAGADPDVADRTGLSPAMLIGCSDAQARDDLLKRHPGGPPPISDERKRRPRIRTFPPEYKESKP